MGDGYAGNNEKDYRSMSNAKKVTRAQFNETYLEDLIAVWKKMGRRPDCG
jgi:hypothetical protein